MKKASKIVSLLLVLAMALPCAVACSKDKEDDENNGVTTSDTATEYGVYDCELPTDLNYNGAEITLLSRDALGQSDEFVSEGITGSIVSDAVYKRNTAVESRLGVKLNQISLADSTANMHETVITAFQNDVLSGGSEYDIVAAPAYTMTSKVTNGIFSNLKALGNVDLNKYYWAQGFNEWAEFGESQYVATGMIALSLYRFMYVTVYNNGFLNDNGVEDIYTLVTNDAWTAEKQYQITKDLYMDNGSTSGVRDTKDTYGFISGARTTVDAYLEAWNLTVLSRDNDGAYSYSGKIERLNNIAALMLRLFYDNDGAYIVSSGEDNTDNAKIVEIFNNGKAAMATMKINAIETGLKDQGFEYSIAPLPKYNDNQKGYKTYVQDQLTCVAVPMTVNAEDRAMIGAVLELMAAESYKNTYNAYFETALSYQYLRNYQSVEMLKIIYESVGFRAYFTTQVTDVSFNSILRNVASSGINTISNQMASYSNASKNVNEYNEKMKALLAE